MTKILLLQVVLLSIFVFNVVNMVHHRSSKSHHHQHHLDHPHSIGNQAGHKIRTLFDEDEEPLNAGRYNNCIVDGHLYCDGKPAVYLRPYLTSPEYPDQIVSIALSHEDGRFRLATGEFIKFTEPVRLEIRHTCPVKGVEPMDRCAIPYFTTSIIIDHRHRTRYYIDVNLDERLHETTPFCLY